LNTLKNRVEKLEHQVQTVNLNDPRWQTLRHWREQHPSLVGGDNLFLILLDLLDRYNPFDSTEPSRGDVEAMTAAWGLYQDFATAQGWGSKTPPAAAESEQL